MSYCMYLRKSRKDLEMERLHPGSTLLRHESVLRSLADSMSLPVLKIYREVGSGDTISGRPVMKQLLSEVEQGKWEGVLVMEIERLARGDSIDQGIVTRTFQYSGTRIITPYKIYEPENDFDLEYLNSVSSCPAESIKQSTGGCRPEGSPVSKRENTSGILPRTDMTVFVFPTGKVLHSARITNLLLSV